MCENYTLPQLEMETTGAPTSIKNNMFTNSTTIQRQTIATTTVTPVHVSGYPNVRKVVKWERAGILLFAFCFGFGCLIFIICYVYHMYILSFRFDIPKFYLIPRYFQNIGDFWTDLFFSIILYLEQCFFLSAFAVIFTIIPFIMQCIICIKFVLEWKYKRSSINDDSQRLLCYLKKYEILIYLSTMFAGFYNSIDLFKSQIFYKKYFLFPLKTKEYDQLRKYRFVNVIMLENIPQLILQLIYIFTINNGGSGVSNISPIVFISMTLSILSIIFAIVKESARIAAIRYDDNNFMTNYSHVTSMKGYFIIESSKLNYYHNFSHKKIQQCLKIVMDTCGDHKCWTNTNDFLYNIEIYYIKDMISNLDQCRAYFEIITKYHERKLSAFAQFKQNIIDIGCAGTSNNLSIQTVE